MAIIAVVGSPQANASASGNKTYVYNAITTTPGVVAPANPQRRKLVFHNPGTNDILVAPDKAFISATATAPTTLTPSTSALGGCWRIFGNGGTLTLEGEIQSSWQAFATTGSTNALTVLDSNI